MEPIRIQRKRTKGWKIPENTIYVGRGSIWGNPFRVNQLNPSKQNKEGGYNQIFTLNNEEACIHYERFLSLELRIKAKESLKGKNLACWCPLNKPCHADILLKIANQ